MSLDLTQRQTLKAAIALVPAIEAARVAGDTATLERWCNAATATQAWRTAVTGSEIYSAHKPVEYIARSAAERSAFDLMVCNNFAHDFGVQAKRNGVADIFSGTTNQTSRTAIFAAAQELATNAQVALGGNVVSVGGTANMAETVSALKRNFTGRVDTSDANWLVNN